MAESYYSRQLARLLRELGGSRTPSVPGESTSEPESSEEVEEKSDG